MGTQDNRHLCYSFDNRRLSLHAFQYSNIVTRRKNAASTPENLASHITLKTTEPTESIPRNKTSLIPLRTRTSDCLMRVSIFIVDYLQSHSSPLSPAVIGAPYMPAMVPRNPHSTAVLTAVDPFIQLLNPAEIGR